MKRKERSINQLAGWLIEHRQKLYNFKRPTYAIYDLFKSINQWHNKVDSRNQQIIVDH